MLGVKSLLERDFRLQYTGFPAEGAEKKMEAAAAKLMDFSRPMDVPLLDQVVSTAFDASHPQVLQTTLRLFSRQKHKKARPRLASEELRWTQLRCCSVVVGIVALYSDFVRPLSFQHVFSDSPFLNVALLLASCSQSGVTQNGRNPWVTFFVHNYTLWRVA